MQELSKSEKFKDVTFVKVNFEQAQDINQRFKVNSKSTLVVLKGKQEIARSIGSTSQAEIAQLIETGI